MTEARKYFGTDGIRGRVGESLITPDFVMRLGWAAGCVFADAPGDKIVIGKDTRISGYMFESALEAGLSAAGVSICLLGVVPTPAIAYLTKALNAKAGIVISASHNPYYDNGIKFFSATGTKLPDEIELAIEKQMAESMSISKQLGKVVMQHEASHDYKDFCKSTVPASLNLKNVKIVVDCSNGATFRIAPALFREFGAEVIELGTKPDGININEKCGSSYPEDLQKTVVAEKADLGIAFDGDGDRVVMVDHKGEIVDGDEILYVMAKTYLENSRIQGGVIGTLMSNIGLEIAVRQLGLEFVRTKVGDRYVLAELHKRGWLLGGESSGHIVWLSATTTGDGIIAALQVLAIMMQTQKSLNELKSGMKKYPQTMINLAIKSDFDPLKNVTIQQAVKDVEATLADRGRVLLRLSGTEPVMRIMVEGEEKTKVANLAQQLADVVKVELSKAS